MRETVIVPFEIKSVSDAPGAMTFEGYASVFGTQDAHDDVIQPGAFATTLQTWARKSKLPKMLLQHGGGFFGGSAEDLVPIGKWASLVEDAKGLYGKGRLFEIETDRTRATYAAMKEGELDALSIGFKTRASSRDDVTGVRTITEIELWEVSLVTFPANDDARLTSVKDADRWPSEREFERLLREAGFSRDHAKGITARGFRALRREVAGEGDSDVLQAVLDGLQRRQSLFK